MTVFWDTNLFLYLVERHPVYHDLVAALRAEHRQSGDRIVTSALTLGEVLVHPLRTGRTDIAQLYREFLCDRSQIMMVTFDLAAAEQYAHIRGKTAIKPPDAMQLACAAAAGCDLFLTNDQRLWGLTGPGLPSVRGIDGSIRS